MRAPAKRLSAHSVAVPARVSLHAPTNFAQLQLDMGACPAPSSARHSHASLLACACMPASALRP